MKNNSPKAYGPYNPVLKKHLSHEYILRIREEAKIWVRNEKIKRILKRINT